jgi:hypothetical protein
MITVEKTYEEILAEAVASGMDASELGILANPTMFRQQADFVNCEQPFCCAVAGRGGGKSDGGAIKLWFFMLANPKCVGFVTAPDLGMLDTATLASVRRVFPKGMYTYAEGTRTLTLLNGSKAIFKSTAEPNAFRGPNMDFAWMDEAAISTIASKPDFQKESFNVILGTMRTNPKSQAWFTTTPSGYNWIYDDFVKGTDDHNHTERCMDCDYWYIKWTSDDNPFILPDLVDRQARSWGESFTAQERYAEFVEMGKTAYFDIDSVFELAKDAMEPIETRRGLVKIWRKPVVGGRYIAGGDLAWGEKGAYSCVTIWDAMTWDQVAEIHGRPQRDEMAQETFDLCTEYNQAYLVMENNGEGANIVNKLARRLSEGGLGYPSKRMFYQDHESVNPVKPGWTTSEGNRHVFLGEFEEATRNHAIRPRCEGITAEMKTFVRDEKNKPVPMNNRYSDHVMSAALAWEGRHHARFGNTASQKPIFENYGW